MSAFAGQGLPRPGAHVLRFHLFRLCALLFISVILAILGSLTIARQWGDLAIAIAILISLVGSAVGYLRATKLRRILVAQYGPKVLRGKGLDINRAWGLIAGAFKPYVKMLSLIGSGAGLAIIFGGAVLLGFVVLVISITGKGSGGGNSGSA